MGLSFISTTATTAEVVFAFDSPWSNAGHRVQYSSIAHDAPTVFGRFTCDGPGVTTLHDSVVTTITDAGSLGNPNARGGFLWFDDEQHTDLRFQVIMGDGGLPGAPLSPERLVAGATDANNRRITPFFHHPTRTLYYSVLAQRLERRALLGGDPATLADWGPVESVAPSDSPSAVGRIFALGEPSVSNLADGGVELYFIYVVLTPTGTNANVARILAR